MHPAPVVNRDDVNQGDPMRDKLVSRQNELVNSVADHTEIASTRAALADILWMAVGALFMGGASDASRGRED